jgi:hypothetical protein
MNTMNATTVSDEVLGTGSTAGPYNGHTFAAASRSQVLALRLAQAADEGPLKRLAELDEQPDLSGELLLAWLGSELVAAISVDDGRVIADPFVATSDAISVLELRAHQLVGRAVRRKANWWRRFVQALDLTSYEPRPNRGRSSQLEKNYWRDRTKEPGRWLGSAR